MKNKIGSFHTHTHYSDGVNSPEEMVLAAIEKGLPAIGFSDHAPTPYCPVGMPPQALPRYLREIDALKVKYDGQIEIYAGLEYDAFAPCGGEGLDYVIGSVHYVSHPQTGERICIDSNGEALGRAIEMVGGGSPHAMLARYYDILVDMVETLRPDIVGHLDLPVKLNGDGKFFDETAPWYRQLEEDTAKRLAVLRPLIEINTGGMRRGYRRMPYPSRHFLELLYGLDVPVILSADAHKTGALDYWYQEALALLREVGYRNVKTLSGDKFVDVSISV